MPMKINNEVYRHALKKCVEIRETELFISRHYPEQIFRCPVHLAIGHEAIPATLLSLHTQDRFIFSYHRSHHHFLASGATIESLIYELAGSPKGTCQGYGGSHHLRNEASGFLGSTPIITGTLPVATGYAHGLKLELDKIKSRVFVFMGDTAGEEGLFYECLNMASLYKLPITFVIEDNGLSCFTPASDRHGFESYQTIAKHFQLPYFETTGDNITTALEEAQKHFDYCEESNGPALFYSSVFRPYEHCGYQIEEEQSYRSIEKSWPARDPLHHIPSQYQEFVSKIKKETQDRCESLLDEIYSSLKGVLP